MFNGQVLTQEKRWIVRLFQQSKKKSWFVVFFENGDDDKNDNHISCGSKLIATWSESTRCHGHTIFENEAVINISRPSFYSKIYHSKASCLVAEWATSKLPYKLSYLISCVCDDVAEWPTFEDMYFYTNRRIINPPLRGSSSPLSRGGFINPFLKYSYPSGACGGLFEKVTFLLSMFS